jgi:hypothetical protein
LPPGAPLAADDAAGDPASDRTKASANDETEDPLQVALAGARTAALERYPGDASNERTAGEAEYHARDSPTSGPSVTALHLDPCERPERDCPGAWQRSATRKLAEGERVAVDSSDEGRPSGERRRGRPDPHGIAGAE